MDSKETPTLTPPHLNGGFPEPGLAPQQSAVAAPETAGQQPTVATEKPVVSPEVSHPGGFKKILHKMSMGILFPSAGTPKAEESQPEASTPTTAAAQPASPETPTPQIPS